MSNVDAMTNYATKGLMKEDEFLEVYRNITHNPELKLESLRHRHKRGSLMPERVEMFGAYYYKEDSVKKVIDQLKKGEAKIKNTSPKPKSRIRVQPVKA